MADMRSIVEQFDEVFNTAEFDRVGDFLSEDCVVIVPGAPPMGRDEWVQFSKPFKDASPDAKITIDRYYEVGDRAITEGRVTGTHTAPLVTPQGEIPPQGKSFDLPYADFFTVKDGKITAHTAYFDFVTFLTSIEAMPAPG